MRSDEMIEYSDKIYKRIRNAGVAGIVLGIIIIVGGIAIGTMSIVFGGSMLNLRKYVVD
jgi:hypothetical protein